MFSKFSKNFGFVRFSGNLQHFLIFQKFWKFWKFWKFFTGLLKICMPATVNATSCLCRTRLLSQPAAACLGVCTNRPQDISGLCT
jgi:hypothetical protein